MLVDSQAWARPPSLTRPELLRASDCQASAGNTFIDPVQFTIQYTVNLSSYAGMQTKVLNGNRWVSTGVGWLLQS